MYYPNEQELEFNHFLRMEPLRNNGSNYMTWYRNLHGVLVQNNVTYVLENFLEDAPGNLASAEAKDAFRRRRDIWMDVQITMYWSMEDELKNAHRHLEPIAMIDALRVLFEDQIKREQFKQLDGFLSFRMEEHTCLETHLSKMFDMHDDLTRICGYWMADTFAIHAVLRSLPPSFEKVVDEYVIKADSILFTDFLAEIKGVKVELIEGEIDDTEGIFDIRVIIVISCILLYYKYLMLMSCLMKQHQSIRGSKRSTSRCCRRIARRSTDGQDGFRS